MVHNSCDRISDMDSASSGTPIGVHSATVLVLGGSGFIGTRLTSLLTAQGIPVRIGDIRASKRFPHLWIRCDVRDEGSLREAMRDVCTIVNLAAEHRDDVRPLSRYHETNVEGASAVCAAACREGIRKILFTSSVAVYGMHPNPVDETGPFEPFNLYGETKLEAEGIYRAWTMEDPTRTLVIVRPTVVFGEGNRGNVYNLARQIASGHFMMVGSGANTKSIAYVGNVAAFLVHSLSFGPSLHIFNYVDTPDMNTRDLVGYIQSCLGKPRKSPRIPLPIALATGNVLDLIARATGRTFPISAIRVRKFSANTQFRADRVAQSGFSPPFSLRESLARTVDFEFSSKELSKRGEQE
jgi:nucleoside-diphosphate-sugar epimerase